MLIEIFYFTSDSCGPCKSFKPKWDEVVMKYKPDADDSIEDINISKRKRYVFKKIKLEKKAEVFDNYNVKSMPTVIISVDGKEDRRLGYSEVKNIDKILSKY